MSDPWLAVCGWLCVLLCAIWLRDCQSPWAHVVLLVPAGVRPLQNVPAVAISAAGLAVCFYRSQQRATARTRRASCTTRSSTLQPCIHAPLPVPTPAEGDRLDVLREVDEVFINAIKEWGLYDKIWQAFAVFLPVRSVGELRLGWRLPM